MHGVDGKKNAGKTVFGQKVEFLHQTPGRDWAWRRVLGMEKFSPLVMLVDDADGCCMRHRCIDESKNRLWTNNSPRMERVELKMAGIVERHH